MATATAIYIAVYIAICIATVIPIYVATYIAMPTNTYIAIAIPMYLEIPTAVYVYIQGPQTAILKGRRQDGLCNSLPGQARGRDALGQLAAAVGQGTPQGGHETSERCMYLIDSM